ncbi:hypothetical protein [Jiangella anatolica]|uniref:hypothetical protein n=1 Tax=Jiangella anatolica TaxID=2670374 RepID=UPI0018F6447B|nr:hypothetical protein [Jiangella anatolica]
MDRLLGEVPQLEVLRAADGAEPVEPSAVLLPTAFGPVKVDVLEVRQVEIDRPSDDPGDRLHATAHAWANDTATDLTIEALSASGSHVEVTTPMAEPGPLIAMKLQAVMNRSAEKQGTDLLDIVRLAFDAATGPVALAQLGEVDAVIAHDIALHVELWFVERRQQSLRRILAAGGADVAADDLDLVAELLADAAHREDG